MEEEIETEWNEESVEEEEKETFELWCLILENLASYDKHG